MRRQTVTATQVSGPKCSDVPALRIRIIDWESRPGQLLLAINFQAIVIYTGPEPLEIVI